MRPKLHTYMDMCLSISTFIRIHFYALNTCTHPFSCVSTQRRDAFALHYCIFSVDIYFTIVCVNVWSARNAHNEHIILFKTHLRKLITSLSWFAYLILNVKSPNLACSICRQNYASAMESNATLFTLSHTEIPCTKPYFHDDPCIIIHGLTMLFTTSSFKYYKIC